VGVSQPTSSEPELLSNTAEFEEVEFSFEKYWDEFDRRELEVAEPGQLTTWRTQRGVMDEVQTILRKDLLNLFPKGTDAAFVKEFLISRGAKCYQSTITQSSVRFCGIFAYVALSCDYSIQLPFAEGQLVKMEEYLASLHDTDRRSIFDAVYTEPKPNTIKEYVALHRPPRSLYASARWMVTLYMPVSRYWTILDKPEFKPVIADFDVSMTMGGSRAHPWWKWP